MSDDPGNAGFLNDADAAWQEEAATRRDEWIATQYLLEAKTLSEGDAMEAVQEAPHWKQIIAAYQKGDNAEIGRMVSDAIDKHLLMLAENEYDMRMG